MNLLGKIKPLVKRYLINTEPSRLKKKKRDKLKGFETKQRGKGRKRKAGNKMGANKQQV